MSTPTKPECRKCKFFHITWDAQMPYGCKLYGLKSRQVPSLIVKTSAADCLGFSPKPLKTDDNYGD